MSKRREAYRQPNELITDAESWDRAVSLLIGPAVVSAHRDKQRADALALLAAVQRAVERLAD